VTRMLIAEDQRETLEALRIVSDARHKREKPICL
jgi:hypothetical protein